MATIQRLKMPNSQANLPAQGTTATAQTDIWMGIYTAGVPSPNLLHSKFSASGIASKSPMYSSSITTSTTTSTKTTTQPMSIWVDQQLQQPSDFKKHHFF